MNPSKMIKRIGTQPHKFRLEFVVHSGENIPFEGQHVYVLVGRGSKTTRSDARIVSQGKVVWEQRTEMFVTLYRDSHQFRFQEKLGFIELRKGIGSNKDVSYMHKEINFADLCNADQTSAHQLEFSSKIEGRPTIIKIECRSDILRGRSDSTSFSQPTSSRARTDGGVPASQTVGLDMIDNLPQDSFDNTQEDRMKSFLNGVEPAVEPPYSEDPTNTLSSAPKVPTETAQNKGQENNLPSDAVEVVEFYGDASADHYQEDSAQAEQHQSQATSSQQKRQLSGSKSRLLNFLRVARSQRGEHPNLTSASQASQTTEEREKLVADGTLAANAVEEPRKHVTDNQDVATLQQDQGYPAQEFDHQYYGEDEEDNFEQDIFLSSGLSPRDALVQIMRESISQRYIHDPPLNFIGEEPVEIETRERFKPQAQTTHLEEQKDAAYLSGASAALLLDEFLQEEEELQHIEFIHEPNHGHPISHEVGEVQLREGEYTISYAAPDSSDAPDSSPNSDGAPVLAPADDAVALVDEDGNEAAGENIDEDVQSGEASPNSKAKAIDEYFPAEVPPLRPPVRIIEEPDAFNGHINGDPTPKWYSPQDMDEIRKNYESEITELRQTVSSLQGQLEPSEKPETLAKEETQPDTNVLNGVKQPIEPNSGASIVEGLNEKLQKVLDERDIYLSLLLAAKVELARYKSMLDSKN